MCDLFWLSPAEQGDLSDVVRASLQQQQQPITPAGFGFSYLQPEEEESLLMEGGGLVVSHGDDKAHGLGMMVSGPCDDVLLHSSQQLQPQGIIGQISLPTPQPGATNVEGEEPEMGDHLHPHPHVHAIKQRKSQTKKVVCIPAPTAAPAAGRLSTSGEVVPSDLWAWRKYGQKPIKGSPYPRGYYRCSSSKDCPARKQVERSRTDPNMLVITYTSDHNHPWPTQRNALAGSTRPSSSAAAKNSSFSAAAALANSNINHGGTAAQLKQETVEAELDLFADMDAIGILSSISKNHQDDSKPPLYDPFSSGFFGWASDSEA